MKIRIFIYAILIVAIVLLQSNIANFIEIYYIKPNLLIVFIISVALLRGNIEGAVIGAIIGLIQDVVSGKILGFYMLLGLYLGLIIGSVNKRLYRENFFVIIFFTFISSIAYEWTVYFLNTVFTSEIDFVYPIKNIILPEAVYNCVVSIFIYVLIIKVNDRFHRGKKVSRKY